MKLHIEIRAGEGGKDAQLLVEAQAGIYLAYAKQAGVSVASEIRRGIG
jgi:protein subunit release factor A